MRPHWEDLDARARGLGTHLLGRARLAALADARDLPALAEDLHALGFPAGEPSAPALDLAIRRAAAARMRTLALWCGPRIGALAILFEDEDRRSLRALLRGAVQGATAETRLAGTIPTPSLPERVLAELARQTSAAAVASLLVAFANPYGPVLLAEARPQHPDLFRLENRLQHAFASRALDAARRAGAALEDYVRETIDLENALAAGVMGAQESDVAAGEAFLDGGQKLGRDRFEAAAAARDPAEAVRRIAAAFARTPFADLWLRHRPGTLEGSILARRIEVQKRAAVKDPLGPAPLLAYALRLRAEVLDLRRLVWGIALEVPAAARALDLVSE